MNGEKYRIIIIDHQSHNLDSKHVKMDIRQISDTFLLQSSRVRNEKKNLISFKKEDTNLKNWFIKSFRFVKLSKLKLRNLPICLLILLSSILLSFPTILLPQHDGIKAPGYWYELMVDVNLTFNLSWVLAVFYDGKNILKITSVSKVGSCMRLYVASALSFDVIYYIRYKIVVGLRCQ